MSVLCIERREDFRSCRGNVPSVQRTAGHVLSPSHPSVLIARAREPQPVSLSPACRARPSLSLPLFLSLSAAPHRPSNQLTLISKLLCRTLRLLFCSRCLTFGLSGLPTRPSLPAAAADRVSLRSSTPPPLSLSLASSPIPPATFSAPILPVGIVSSFTLSSRSLYLPRSLLLTLISRLFRPIPSSLPRQRQLLAPLQSPASLSLSLFLPVVLFNPLRSSSRLFHLGCAIDQAAGCSSSRQRPPFSSLSLICSLSWAVGLHRPASFRHEKFIPTATSFFPSFSHLLPILGSWAPPSGKHQARTILIFKR